MNQNDKGYLASHALEFDYETPAPKATKINILTVGNICITSIWQDGLGHKGWSPLPARNKEKEKELGLL